MFQAGLRGNASCCSAASRDVRKVCQSLNDRGGSLFVRRSMHDRLHPCDSITILRVPGNATAADVPARGLHLRVPFLLHTDHTLKVLPPMPCRRLRGWPRRSLGGHLHRYGCWRDARSGGACNRMESEDALQDHACEKHHLPLLENRAVAAVALPHKLVPDGGWTKRCWKPTDLQEELREALHLPAAPPQRRTRTAALGEERTKHLFAPRLTVAPRRQDAHNGPNVASVRGRPVLGIWDALRYQGLHANRDAPRRGNRHENPIAARQLENHHANVLGKSRTAR
mmetsp:Transcript_101593/g.286482  ORF Transcript_101593/g.286482 Transcript_101593/m.286482 type:complete len:283 (-) Transcript_101593:8-856(-)